MSKKSEAYIALENAARMALAAGVEWSTARNAVAKQYGAVFREGEIDGWARPKVELTDNNRAKKEKRK